MGKSLRDYKYIAFDLDGTLMNTYEGIAGGIRHVMESFGKEPPTEEQVRLCIGPPLDDSLVRYFGFSPEDATAGVAKFREYYVPIGQSLCRPYEGIEEVLKQLAAMGKILFVATSKPVGPAKAILDNFGLSKYFAHIAGTPPGAGDFSKADVLALAFQSLGNPPKDDIILIGDTRFDIIGAKETGIASMGVLYGFGSREEFIAHGANYIVETVPDILASFK